MVITDFGQWIDLTLENVDDAIELYTTVKDQVACGSFTIKSQNEQWVVQCSRCDDELLILSEKAKEALLKMIQYRFSEEGIPMEIYYHQVIQNRKND